MRIAHLSDPHLLDLEGVAPHRIALSKRLTGWVNLKLRRGHKHRPRVVEALIEDLRSQGFDHVAVTGDLTNLALEAEFERARKTLSAIGLSPSEVSVVPGNHDVYTRGAERGRRFATYFSEHLTGDLDLGPGTHVSGPFPFVRLRGPVAIIGVSTAVARLPLVSSGYAGRAQRAALQRALEHPALRGRTPVVLSHHPLVNPDRLSSRLLRGLSDADALREVFARRETVLALHGHLHHRGHSVLPNAAGGRMHLLGATSASLVHDHPERMAGYNTYELDDSGAVVALRARVWDPRAERFEERALAASAAWTS